MCAVLACVISPQCACGEGGLYCSLPGYCPIGTSSIHLQKSPSECLLGTKWPSYLHMATVENCMGRAKTKEDVTFNGFDLSLNFCHCYPRQKMDSVLFKMPQQRNAFISGHIIDDQYLF